MSGHSLLGEAWPCGPHLSLAQLPSVARYSVSVAQYYGQSAEGKSPVRRLDTGIVGDLGAPARGEQAGQEQRPCGQESGGVWTLVDGRRRRLVGDFLNGWCPGSKMLQSSKLCSRRAN